MFWVFPALFVCFHPQYSLEAQSGFLFFQISLVPALPERGGWGEPSDYEEDYDYGDYGDYGSTSYPDYSGYGDVLQPPVSPPPITVSELYFNYDISSLLYNINNLLFFFDFFCFLHFSVLFSTCLK